MLMRACAVVATAWENLVVVEYISVPLLDCVLLSDIVGKISAAGARTMLLCKPLCSGASSWPEKRQYV